VRKIYIGGWLCGDQGTEIREQRSGNRDQGTEIREQRSGNREQGTENREQGTENREQGTENREQRTGNRDQGSAKPCSDDCFYCAAGGVNYVQSPALIQWSHAGGTRVWFFPRVMRELPMESWGSWFPRSQKRDLGHPANGEFGFVVSRSQKRDFGHPTVGRADAS
jgi:hypothetical protein